MARYSYGYGGYGGWAPYVPVAERRRQAEKRLEALRKKGLNVQPVVIEGRTIAKTFWGKAWCGHLESFSDFANRLPRGRTYVCNGSVCHLAVAQGEITAKVSGSELYDVKIAVKPLDAKKWADVKSRCSGRIGSLLELLQGRLSDEVMSVVADREEGLFPLPGEISMQCSCPDWATMCKHVAAVLYGVGSRLDQKPELLFLLRGVDHQELIAADAEKALSGALTQGKSKRLSTAALGDVFGIDLETSVAASAANAPAGDGESSSARTPAAARPAARKTNGDGKAASPRSARASRQSAAAPKKSPAEVVAAVKARAANKDKGKFKADSKAKAKPKAKPNGKVTDKVEAKATPATNAATNVSTKTGAKTGTKVGTKSAASTKARIRTKDNESAKARGGQAEVEKPVEKHAAPRRKRTQQVVEATT